MRIGQVQRSPLLLVPKACPSFLAMAPASWTMDKGGVAVGLATISIVDCGAKHEVHSCCCCGGSDGVGIFICFTCPGRTVSDDNADRHAGRSARFQGSCRARNTRALR